MVSRILILIMLLVPSVSMAQIFECIISGIYEHHQGELVQRTDRSGIGRLIVVDAESGEITGYFGTDGDEVEVVRVSTGFLSIEKAQGLLGNSANRMSIFPSQSNPDSYNFTYNKNWLVVSGSCLKGT